MYKENLVNDNFTGYNQLYRLLKVVTESCKKKKEDLEYVIAYEYLSTIIEKIKANVRGNRFHQLEYILLSLGFKVYRDLCLIKGPTTVLRDLLNHTDADQLLEHIKRISLGLAFLCYHKYVKENPGIDHEYSRKLAEEEFHTTLRDIREREILISTDLIEIGGQKRKRIRKELKFLRLMEKRTIDFLKKCDNKYIKEDPYDKNMLAAERIATILQKAFKTMGPPPYHIEDLELLHAELLEENLHTLTRYDLFNYTLCLYPLSAFKVLRTETSYLRERFHNFKTYNNTTKNKK